MNFELNKLNKLIVSKFGGTSMGDADCMRRSARIVIEQGSYLVCVSATAGTTNQLIEIARHTENLKNEMSQFETNLHESTLKLIDRVVQKHIQIADELSLSANVLFNSQFQNLLVELKSVVQGMHLLGDCSPRAMDILVSLGERLSSVLFSRALELEISQSASLNSLKLKKVYLLDARDVIVTDEQFGQAHPQIDMIQKRCQSMILQKFDVSTSIVVTQGFIGRSQAGHSTTLGRGGSDYSAALFAEGLNASAVEIWTDVPGIATTDPRICSDAKSISEISFKEASEMAIFGAKVLHPATVEPAMRKNIPVFVGSSFESQKKGTWVKKEVLDTPLVRAIALRRHQSLVTLTTPQMLQTHGFLFKIFKVFNDHCISIDAITTSEISVSVTIDSSVQLTAQLVKDLENFADLKVESGLSLVSLIGNKINHTAGLAKKIFTAIDDINVRMICLGASKHNFCFLVENDTAEEVVRRLHKAFV